MPEKVIIHNSGYDIVERNGTLYIIPQPTKPISAIPGNVLASVFTVVICVCLLAFPAFSIFLLLSLLFTSSLKKGLL